jgi:hypothetical protein
MEQTDHFSSGSFSINSGSLAATDETRMTIRIGPPSSVLERGGGDGRSQSHQLQTIEALPADPTGWWRGALAANARLAASLASACCCRSSDCA